MSFSRRAVSRGAKTRLTSVKSRPRSGLRFSGLSSLFVRRRNPIRREVFYEGQELAQVPLSDLREIADTRSWSPAGTGYRNIHGRASRVVRASPKRQEAPHDPFRGVLEYWRSSPEYEVFWVPHKALVCIRRRIRREVIHAKRLAGKGGQRKAKWRDSSRIRCVEV